MPKKKKTKFPKTVYLQKVDNEVGFITWESLEDTDLDYPDIAVYELKKVGKRVSKITFE